MFAPLSADRLRANKLQYPVEATRQEVKSSVSEMRNPSRAMALRPLMSTAVAPPSQPAPPTPRRGSAVEGWARELEKAVRSKLAAAAPIEALALLEEALAHGRPAGAAALRSLLALRERTRELAAAALGLAELPVAREGVTLLPGLRPGDVIVAIDGQAAARLGAQWPVALRDAQQATVVRDGVEQDVVLRPSPRAQQLSASAAPFVPRTAQDRAAAQAAGSTTFRGDSADAAASGRDASQATNSLASSAHFVLPDDLDPEPHAAAVDRQAAGLPAAAPDGRALAEADEDDDGWVMATCLAEDVMRP